MKKPLLAYLSFFVIAGLSSFLSLDPLLEDSLGELQIENYRGNIEIKTCENSIYVFVDTLDIIGNGDGVADYAFILQVLEELDKGKYDMRMENVVLAYEQESLLITTSDKENVVELLLDRAKQQYPTSNPILGYGLAKWKSQWEFPISEEDFIVMCNLSQNTSCDSGGEGASSCMVNCGGQGGSCSVTCNRGYYACCNCGTSSEEAECYCIKEGPQ